MAKRAQAALEFLMTYGWAILVVLAAIGALAYFGVLSPEKFLPEKCTISPGIDCAGFDIRATSAIISLRNGMGKSLTIDSIKVGNNCCVQKTGSTDCGNNATATAYVEGVARELPTEFKNGDAITLELKGCNNGAIGDRFRQDIILRYTEDLTGISKLTDGNVVGRIKE